jgi:hypothetical protein
MTDYESIARDLLSGLYLDVVKEKNPNLPIVPCIGGLKECAEAIATALRETAESTRKELEDRNAHHKLHDLEHCLDAEFEGDWAKAKCKELQSRIREMEQEIKDRQETEQFLTNWVSKDGERIRELEELLKRCVSEVGGDMYSHTLMDIEQALSKSQQTKGG